MMADVGQVCRRQSKSRWTLASSDVACRGRDRLGNFGVVVGGVEEIWERCWRFGWSVGGGERRGGWTREGEEKSAREGKEISALAREGEDFGLGISRKRVKGEAFCGERVEWVVDCYWIGSNRLLSNLRWSFE